MVFIRWFILLLSLLIWKPVYGSPLQMSYSGRIVGENGVPATGPITVNIRFYDSQVDGNQLSTEKVFEGIKLQEGIFQIVISFVSNELGLIFADNKETWIQVTDATNGVDYERQMFTAVPFAFRIPVDGTTLKFSESDGKLQVNELRALNLKANQGSVLISPHQEAFGEVNYTLPKADGNSGDVLATQGNGQLGWVDPATRENPLDSNSNGIADKSEDAVKLNGKDPDFYLRMDNMLSGNNNVLFTAADKTKLDNLELTSSVTTASVDNAGAVMASDLPNQSGLLTTNGSGSIGVDTTTYLSSEADPTVGDVSVSGQWCVSDGSAIQCDQSAPVLQSQLGTGSNQVVQMDGTKLPAVDGSQLTNLNLAAPGAIGGTTPNQATFSSLRLHDGSHYMTLRAPTSSLGDNSISLAFPTSAPVDGRYLMTNGSGQLSWADPGAINSSAISTNTSNIATNATNISGKQAADSDLTDIAGLTHTDGNFMVSNGTNWTVEAGSTARASLDLEIGVDVQAYNANTTVLGATIEASEMSGTGTLPAFNGSALTNISADQIGDGTTNKVFTATEKTKLSGIGAGADITAVTGSNGISAGGSTGDIALTADTNYLQRRVSSSCSAGTYIRSIAADGTVTCSDAKAAFSAWYSGDSFSSSAFPLVFDQELFDEGNNYDPSTGEFTCPVTGHYWVSSHFAKGGSTTQSANLSISVNGGVRIQAQEHDNSDGYTTIAVQGAVQCNGGQKITINLYLTGTITMYGPNNTGSSNKGRNNFSVMLIK